MRASNGQTLLGWGVIWFVLSYHSVGLNVARGQSQTGSPPQTAQESSAQDQNPQANNTQGNNGRGQNIQGQNIQSPPMPDLSIPENASVEQLQALVAKARAVQPRSPQQYRAMQTAIRDASRQILALLQEAPTSAAYRQAELDRISASVTLMSFFGKDAQKKTMDQLHQFLKSREKLELTDIQTGMLAAAMLELQPNKQPALQTYQLMDELLANDDRREMQALRINLQANVNRLGLLGNKMTLSATTIDGQEIAISSFVGKFLLINFFAVQLTQDEKCTACFQEVARLKKHYEQYHSKGLEIIGISLDANLEVLESFRESEKLPWPIIHDRVDDPLKSLRLKFGISQLPTVFLLNKEGTVVSLEARGAELDRLMQMLFETPTPAPPPTEATTSDASDGQTPKGPQDESS
jgi:peroxiredoxin